MRYKMIFVNIIIASICGVTLITAIVVAFLGKPKPLVAIFSLAVLVYAIANIIGLDE